MLEAEATADMLLITQPFGTPPTADELSLRVKAQDRKGKTRKLEVSSRRAYFMPKDGGALTAANQ